MRKSTRKIILAVMMIAVVVGFAAFLGTKRSDMGFEIWARQFEVHHTKNGNLSFITAGTNTFGVRGIGAINAQSGTLLWFVEHPSTVFTTVGRRNVVSLAGSNELDSVSIMLIDSEDGRLINRFTVPTSLGAVYKPGSEDEFLYFKKAQNHYLKVDVISGAIEDITGIPNGSIEVGVSRRVRQSFSLKNLQDEDFGSAETAPAPIKELIGTGETLLRMIDLVPGEPLIHLFWLETTGSIIVGQLAKDRSRALWTRSIEGGIPLGRERSWSRQSHFGTGDGIAVFEITPMKPNPPLLTTIFGVDIDRGIQLWEQKRSGEIVEQTYLENGRYYRLLYSQPGPLKIDVIDARSGEIL